MTALAAEKNVEVTGTVDDVRPYYRRALAAIVPLRTGGGTRLKILEAMAAGVPVLSTTLGAEGLAAYELNISCPNVACGGIQFGSGTVVRLCRGRCDGEKR